MSLSPSSSSGLSSAFSAIKVHLLQQVQVLLQHAQNSEHDICALLHEHLAETQGESEEHVQRINFSTLSGAGFTPTGNITGKRHLVSSSLYQPWLHGSIEGGSTVSLDRQMAACRCARLIFSLRTSMVGGRDLNFGAVFLSIFLFHRWYRASDMVVYLKTLKQAATNLQDSFITVSRGTSLFPKEDRFTFFLSTFKTVFLPIPLICGTVSHPLSVWAASN